MPRYVIEGDPQRKLEAKAPKLRSIADLAQYAEVFRDPEEPGKGRFYNCPAGWTCELENSEMLKSYGLEETFTNFRPGTGPALDAAVLSSYRRGEPILFYYWSPTPLMGRADLVRLEERPGVDKRIRIQVGLSRTFHDQAPELVAVLEKVNLPAELLNSDLARMARTGSMRRAWRASSSRSTPRSGTPGSTRTRRRRSKRHSEPTTDESRPCFPNA